MTTKHTQQSLPGLNQIKALQFGPRTEYSALALSSWKSPPFLCLGDHRLQRGDNTLPYALSPELELLQPCRNPKHTHITYRHKNTHTQAHAQTHTQKTHRHTQQTTHTHTALKDTTKERKLEKYKKKNLIFWLRFLSLCCCFPQNRNETCIYILSCLVSPLKIAGSGVFNILLSSVPPLRQ